MSLFEVMKKELVAPKSETEIRGLISRCGLEQEADSSGIEGVLTKALFTTKKQQLRAMEGLEKVVSDIENYGELQEETYSSLKMFIHHVLIVESMAESKSVQVN